jgi:uncharacterized protein YPO0396
MSETTPTLAQIERTCEWYARTRDTLQSRIDAMQADIDQVKQRHLSGVRAALREVNTAEATLRAEVQQAPHLFERPRSAVFHGIKVGWQKGKGGIAWDDAERVIALIRKHLPDQVEALIRVREEPVKAALAELDAATLKRLGVHIVDAGDEVLVRATATDLDKLIRALQGDEGLTEA